MSDESIHYQLWSAYSATAEPRSLNQQAIQSRPLAPVEASVESVPLHGSVNWKVMDAKGIVVRSGHSDNLVTQVGDQLYGERGAGVASPPAVATGMKLGTGTTAAAKTGAGAALVTYLTNSHQAFDTGYPASSLSGSARRITYVAIFAPGKATSASAIREAVIVNETLADATSVAANTIARTVLIGVGSKGAGETLTITWAHDLMGA